MVNSTPISKGTIRSTGQASCSDNYLLLFLLLARNILFQQTVLSSFDLYRFHFLFFFRKFVANFFVPEKLLEFRGQGGHGGHRGVGKRLRFCQRFLLHH